MTGCGKALQAFLQVFHFFGFVCCPGGMFYDTLVKNAGGTYDRIS